MTVTERPADRTAAPPPSPPPPPPESARLTYWSWAMVPIFGVLWLLVGTVVFHWLQGPLGIHEGEVFLMARSVAGWCAELGTDLVVMAAPVAGVLLGRVALRRRATWAARGAILVNAVLGLVLLYTLVDDIHMTYFPGWWG